MGLSVLEDTAVKKLRRLKAIGYARLRQVRRWTDARPYMRLAVFPFWGDPRSFPVTSPASLRKRFWGGFALVTIATAPWVSAYSQVQSLFVDMNEAKAVAEIGQVAFDKLEIILEFSSRSAVLNCGLAQPDTDTGPPSLQVTGHGIGRAGA